MDVSLLQPLSVDCSVEYELEMCMFPRWDDPLARAQPSVMLHRSESCTCQSQLTSDDEEHEDDLPTVTADLFCYEIFNDLPYETISSQQSPAVAQASSQTLEDVLPNGRTFTDLMCDPYIIGPMTPSPLSPVCFSSTSQISPFALRDVDFLLLSPAVQPMSWRKRKHDGDSDGGASAAKRHCNYGDDLFSELYMTFNTNTAEPKVSYPSSPSSPDADNEMGYDFIAPVRD